jgi:hypothetical protein
MKPSHKVTITLGMPWLATALDDLSMRFADANREERILIMSGVLALALAFEGSFDIPAAELRKSWEEARAVRVAEAKGTLS